MSSQQVIVELTYFNIFFQDGTGLVLLTVCQFLLGNLMLKSVKKSRSLIVYVRKYIWSFWIIING